MIVTKEEFQTKYGGKLENLTKNAAVMPKAGWREPLEQAETKPRKKYVYLEFELQKNLAKYLNMKYPHVLFECSPINLNLTKAQRGMISAISKDDFHPPDMKIYAKRGEFVGLALELKKENPYKNSGELKSSEHLKNQWRSILKMRQAGWSADFFWEFDQARKAIDEYLSKTDTTVEAFVPILYA